MKKIKLLAFVFSLLGITFLTQSCGLDKCSDTTTIEIGTQKFYVNYVDTLKTDSSVIDTNCQVLGNDIQVSLTIQNLTYEENTDQTLITSKATCENGLIGPFYYMKDLSGKAIFPNTAYRFRYYLNKGALGEDAIDIEYSISSDDCKDSYTQLKVSTVKFGTGTQVLIEDGIADAENFTVTLPFQ